MYFHFYPRGGADQLGRFFIFALVWFVLLFLLTSHWKKNFQRSKRPKSPRQKAVLVMGGAFVGLLLIMILGIYLG